MTHSKRRRSRREAGQQVESEDQNRRDHQPCGVARQQQIEAGYGQKLPPGVRRFRVEAAAGLRECAEQDHHQDAHDEAGCRVGMRRQMQVCHAAEGQQRRQVYVERLYEFAQMILDKATQSSGESGDARQAHAAGRDQALHCFGCQHGRRRQ